MNTKLTQLLDYLSTHKLDNWNYSRYSPTEVFPILWPETFCWNKDWNCLNHQHTSPRFPSEFLGITLTDYFNLFVYLEIDDPSADEKFHYPSQDEFISALKTYIANH
jgi:hypothetical protein